MARRIESSFLNILTYGLTDQIYAVRPVGNRQFVYDFLNKAACIRTTLTEEVVGKNLSDVLSNKEAIYLIEKYQEVVDTNKVVKYRDSYRKDGGTFYSETILTPLYDQSDHIYLIVAAVKDVTDQIQAERELKQIWAELNKSKKRYESLFRNNPDAILSFDFNRVIMNSNPQMADLLNYTSVELKGRQVSTIFDEHSVEGFNQLLTDALNGETKVSRTLLRDKGNKLIHVTVKLSPIVINHEVEGIYAIFHDISAQLKSEQRLYESEERLKVIAENANDLITLLNHQGKIVYASPSHKRIVGFNEQEYVNKIFLYNTHPDDQENLNKIVTKSIKNGKPFTIETRHITNDEDYIWLESKGTPVFDDLGLFKHMVVLSRDITVQKNNQKKLEFDAMHDHLTDLPNRRLFKLHLNKAINNNNQLAVLMADIDDFKRINDSFGHDVGDAVIREFGKRMEQLLTERDIVARLGGDEFIMLVQGQTEKEVIHLAQEIKKRMDEDWKTIKDGLKVTASIGITMNQNSNPFEIMKQADLALYDSKKEGKDGFSIFSQG
ncbi:PAS domain S-box protein [Gracilibacillus xinjiangensis]|uniref:PAS domain S-box protein n=1 Tax=Gracilibacillus xinjiangensis TaxID=1193282 RepID=A0ABV8WVH7_9BACI